MLKLALALLESKTLINHLYQYGITPTYPEVRRFNTPSASPEDNAPVSFSGDILKITQ